MWDNEIQKSLRFENVFLGLSVSNNILETTYLKNNLYT